VLEAEPDAVVAGPGAHEVGDRVHRVSLGARCRRVPTGR
jgi:hypothetical protein